MLRYLHLLTILLLFVALFKPIVSADSRPIWRTDRASRIDTTKTAVVNSNSFMDNKVLFNHQQQEERQQVELGLQQQKENDVQYAQQSQSIFNKLLGETFILGTDNRTVLFNQFANGSDGTFTTTTTQRPKKTSFVFSDQLANFRPSKLCPEMEEGKTFCTRVTNYPDISHLEDELKRAFMDRDIFFNEDQALPQDITQRINEPGEESLCESQERIIFPKGGETKEQQNLHIVNVDKYKQGIRIEECVAEQKSCKFSEHFPSGYRAICKQNYSYRNLVAISENGKIVTDNFLLPSCCKCVVKQTHN